MQELADPKLQAIAADTNHQLAPHGLSKQTPASALVVNAMLFKHSNYPNAAKEYLRFMMERNNTDPGSPAAWAIGGIL